MSVILKEDLTDNVVGSVWLATLILTYENQVVRGYKDEFFKQSDIQQYAQKLCVQTVHHARISQWCNGDHPKNLYNYLRANNKRERRLIRQGEFNYSKEYPQKLLEPSKIVFRTRKDGVQVSFGDLFEWYRKEYSKGRGD